MKTENINKPCENQPTKSGLINRLVRLFTPCKHDWKIISDTTTKSKIEIVMASLCGKSDEHRKIKLPWQLCDAERNHIQILSCSKCGKLKRFSETI